MKKTMFGARELEFGGKYLDADLRESNDALHDVEELRRRMADDGYLLIRGLHDRDQVVQARRELLEAHAQAGQLDPGADLMDGMVNPDRSGGTGWSLRDLAKRSPTLKAVSEGQPIMSFFAEFLGADVLTFDYKWVRAVAPGGNSGAHYDVVYMGRGSRNLYTCWTPLGDLSLDMGTLAICEGSHRFEKIKQTYGQMDVDRDLVAGWFSNDPVEIVDKFGGKWRTSSFRMGDVLLFSMYTMHASTNNMSNRFRLSADTRYQPAGDPVDERWVGEEPMAHYAWGKGKMKPMEQARAEWGLA